MKRMTITLCVVLALLLAVGGSAAAVGARVDAASREVTFRETCLFGDRRAADGLSVLLEISGHGDEATPFDDGAGGWLNWDTTYTFGETPRVETEFWFDTHMDLAEYPHVWTPISTSLDDAMKSSPYIDAIYEEMKLEAVSPGDEVTRIVSVSEFMATLPLTVHPEAFDQTFAGTEPEGGFDSWLPLADMLEEKLVIPVDPSWTVELYVRRNNNEQHTYSSGYSVGDAPQVYSLNLNTPEASYIILQPKLTPWMEEGKNFNYAIRELGLYRLPRDASKLGAGAFDVDGLTQLWDSADGRFAVDVQMDPITGCLILLVHDGARYFLLEMNGESGEILSESALGYGPLYTITESSEPCPRLHVGEDYAVVRLGDHFLSLVERGEDGRLHETLTVEHPAEPSLFDPEHPAWVTSQGPTFWATTPYYGNILSHQIQLPRVWYDYRDGRLAVYSQRNMGCGFAVAVYGDGRLLYHAQYASSLDAQGLSGNYDCYPRVRWTSWDFY